ncbi:signal transduction histidine kinase [Roseovarius sp. MBR-51]
MIRTLSNIFRSDEFISSSEIFPDIDKDRIARDLSLEEAGRKRGGEGQPGTTSETLDHIELKAISRVESLRRRGLENFETNRRVYSERLNKASSARMLVETEAEDAKARFTEEVTKWRAMMVTPRERVQETYRWRTQFREQNKIGARPARLASSWPNIIGLALIMILLEAAGNAYLFSQNNPLGILGGLIAAFLVSFANVSMSTFLGIAARFINVKGFQNLLKKFFGLLFCMAWLAFALGYNAAVAHFRDAVETTLQWREAGEMAIDTLIANPVGLNTMESYVLFLLGFFISIVAFLKGYHSSDPYPGYSKVAADVVQARDTYIGYLEDSIDTLAEHRDEAVDALRQARDEVARHIHDSVDALYGQKALQANLSPFLEQCNISANYLLAVYRDANKAARKDDGPAYFDKEYAFEVFQSPVSEDDRRKEAEEQVNEVSKMVDRAIKEIFDVFHRSVQEHYEIDELEGTKIDRMNRHISKSVPVTGDLKVVAADKEAV